jgi:hypothetical protein
MMTDLGLEEGGMTPGRNERTGSLPAWDPAAGGVSAEAEQLIRQFPDWSFMLSDVPAFPQLGMMS